LIVVLLLLSLVVGIYAVWRIMEVKEVADETLAAVQAGGDTGTRSSCNWPHASFDGERDALVLLHEIRIWAELDHAAPGDPLIEDVHFQQIMADFERCVHPDLQTTNVPHKHVCEISELNRCGALRAIHDLARDAHGISEPAASRAQWKMCAAGIEPYPMERD
jgi:hypothetical protein